MTVGLTPGLKQTGGIGVAAVPISQRLCSSRVKVETLGNGGIAEFISEVHPDLNTLTRPNGADLAPEYLYRAFAT